MSTNARKLEVNSMNMICKSSFAKKFLNDQSGQVLIWVTLGFLSLIAVAGLVIDGGQAYADHAILQNSANAAALAAAGEVYNTNSTSGAVATGTSYSGSTGDTNSNTNMPGAGTVSTTVTPVCLNLLMPTGQTCSGTGNVPNAVHALQSNTVNTFFMRFFGVKKLSINAEATATMQGLAQKWNVAIILDATPSMATKDPYCSNSSDTAEQCALTGIQTMLSSLNPCVGGGSGCTTSSAYATFRVSLFTFPNVSSTTIGYDTSCSGTKPNEQIYTLPVIPASTATTGYTPVTYTSKSGSSFTASYQVTPGNSVTSSDPDAYGFSSDYYSTSSANNLNTSSTLVKAVGYGSTNGCLVPPTGISSYGGGGITYFASAIYAAQAALQAEKAAVDKIDTSALPSKNAIIFVSDGQANTESVLYPTSTWTATPTGDGLVALTGNGTYPDDNQDCQQAIMASQAVQTAGTRFYAVAYGSEANGCVTDTKVVTTGTLNVPITKSSQVIPCVVMEDMASPGATSTSPWYFYTDGSSAANGCTDTTHTATNLNSIFGAISSTFSAPRLIPNSAT
jgi:Flp pilus assembly protein TadG